MNLQTVTDLNVDFYDKRYILINAKQYDRSSRFLSITCYNHGELYHINAGEHSAYIRYRKSDENSVFNFCEIDKKGKIQVELTEQMLASDGICYADLVIVAKGHANVDAETGEIVAIDNSAILSTMTFCIDVSETAVANSDIESTHEFNLLNTNLEKYWADFEDVMKTSKSWAIGEGGMRSDEKTDNAKHYCEQSSINRTAAKLSETNAKTSEINAKTSETNSKTSETNAADSASAAKTSETNAKTSEVNAKTSEQKAGTSEANAKISETNAKASENAAKISETNAKNSEINANTSETNAKTSETNAKTSETKTSEYCEQVKNIVDGLNSGFIPMGTISFAELSTVDKVTGYVYNINEDFITDDTFKEGAGKSYTVGSNVYCTGDGFWDCFGGSASATATIDEVKAYLGI